MTVSDLVTAALRNLGVLAEGEVPTAAQATDGLAALNDLVNQWQAERLQIYQLLNTTKALTPSQANYTVGLTGNIPIARPMFLDHVAWIDGSSPNVYYSMEELTDAAYSNLSIPNLTSAIPTHWWYQTTFPLATLWLWPIPTSTGIFVSLDYQSPVSEFAALTDTVSLPPGYKRMLRTNLALELAPDYPEIQAPGSLIRAAENSMAAVKRSNQKLEDLYFSPESLIGNRGSSYNILSDN